MPRSASAAVINQRMGRMSDKRLAITVLTAYTTEYPDTMSEPIAGVMCRSARMVGNDTLNMVVFMMVRKVPTLHTGINQRVATALPTFVCYPHCTARIENFV